MSFSNIEMRFVYIGFSLLLAILTCSCKTEEQKGTFLVDVTWADSKPDEPCWIFADVRQVQPEGLPKVVAAAAPVLYGGIGESDGGVIADDGDVPGGGDADAVSLPIPAVPFGEDYVVVINVKENAYDDDPKLMYSGSSDRFSLADGDETSLSVVLSRVKLSIIDEEDGMVLDPEVDVHLKLDAGMFAEFVGETTVSLSNDEGFAAASTVTVPLTSLEAYKQGFIWRDWNLFAGLCEGPCEDGRYSVYARFLNPVLDERGITAYNRTEVDATIPTLEKPVKLPAYTNEDIPADLDFDEDVYLSSESINCDGLGPAEVKLVDGEELEDGGFLGDEFEIICPVDEKTENRGYTLSLSVTDEAGHPTGPVNLGTVIVDTVAAEVADVVRLEPPVVGLDETIAIDFTITEPATEFAVYLGSTRDISDSCAVDSDDPLLYSCRYTTTGDELEGDTDIFVLLRDRASNESELKLDDAVRIDFSAPFVLSYNVSPAVAKAGDEVEVTVRLSEDPALIDFDWDGLNFDDVSADPDNENEYHATYTVQENDDNRTYSFEVTASDGAGNPSDDLFIGEVLIDTVPPELEGDIAVSDSVAAAGETFTFRFTLSEVIDDLSVYIGVLPIDLQEACDVGDNERSYTCSHTVDEQESEGPKTITITMRDEAGNTGNVTETEAIVYNFATPVVISTLLRPEMANGRSTILVGITFSEPVRGVVLDWDGLPAPPNPDPESLATTFSFDIPVESTTPDGTYRIELLAAEDEAGAGAAPRTIGTVTVDKLAPVVVNNVLEVDDPLVRDGDNITISFEVSETLSRLAVTIDDLTLPGSFGENCDTKRRCTFHHRVSDLEEDGGAKKIYVEMTDLAENQRLSVFNGLLSYDFAAPRVIRSTVIPETATDGSEITVSMTFSEEILYDALRIDGSGLSCGSLSGTDDPRTFESVCVVQAANPQGWYSFWVDQVTDLAGNTGSDFLLGEAKIQRVLYVRDSATGNGDGLSWQTAYKELSKALDEAMVGNQVWVRRGVYHPALSENEEDARRSSFELPSGIAVFGGFAGDEDGVDERQLSGESSLSVLDGRLLDEELEDPFAYHVVTARTRNRLDGFLVRNGAADGLIPHNVGGGILVEKGQLTLENCVIRDNLAATSGGGVYSYMSTLRVANTAFFGNEAGKEGGALYHTDSFVDIQRSAFSGNRSSRNGGAIVSVNAPRVVIGNSVFTENDAGTGYGGAVRGQNSSTTLFNCLFAGNQARYGGGLSDRSCGTLQIYFSTFFGNTANLSGHGMYLEDSLAADIDISNTILWGALPAESCQLMTSKIEGDIALAYVDIPDCPEVTNLVCDGGCLSSPPLFESTGFDEDAFRLSSGSPCIDAGRCDLAPLDILDIDNDTITDEPLPLDLGDEPRCVDEADLGAFEVP